MDNAFSIGNWGSERIDFHLPYINGDKVFILRDSLKNCNKMKLDFDVVFGNTITSYNPDENGISSGKSGSDVERILAFDSIGRKDPIQYQDSWETVLSNAKKEQLRHS